MSCSYIDIIITIQNDRSHTQRNLQVAVPNESKHVGETGPKQTTPTDKRFETQIACNCARTVCGQPWGPGAAAMEWCG
eukprot:2155838-Rhodomonas_salina.1